MAMAHKGLAKLAEELGELTQVVGKKLAYPDVEIHPDGSDLDSRLEDEIADVQAALMFVQSELKLSFRAIERRTEAKFDQYIKWSKEP